MNSPNLRKGLIRLTQIVLLAIVYYAAARLAQSLAIPPGNITPVWPASGISLAAVLLMGYEVWPGIWLGEFLESIVAFLRSTDSPPLINSIATASGIGLAVTVAYLLGSFLLRRFIGRKVLLNRTGDVFKFVGLAAMLCCAVSATIGTTSICLGGMGNWAEYQQVWTTWFLGDTVGIIVVTPVLLTWSEGIKKTKFKLASINKLFDFSFINEKSSHFLEAGLLLVLLAIVCQIVFGGGYPVSYLVIPFLVWATFRFGQIGATFPIIIVSSIAIWGTVHGHGPFIRGNLNESLLLLQAFVGVVTITTLILSALIAEREQAQSALLKANEELEQRVIDRTIALSETNEALRQSESQLREQATQLEKTLSQLKTTQTQLIQTEKMSSLGQLVAGMAHEINNPVSFIYSNINYANNYIEELLHLLQMYQHKYPDPGREIQSKIEDIELDFLVTDLPKVLNSMQSGATRIRDIVLSLRNFSRLDESQMKPVNIHEGLESTLLILQNRLSQKVNNSPLQVIKEYENLPLVECYAGELNQVFINIITNAIDALELSNAENPTIRIRTEIADGDNIAIRIADNGPGMSADVQKRLFDPFFTTKPVGKGTGLGLSISYQIVMEKHGGQLKCFSMPGEGTEFSIQIPISQKNRN